METVDLSTLSVEQLEKELAKKKDAALKEKNASKKAYEQQRDLAVEGLMEEAINFSSMLTGFKTVMHQMFDDQRESLEKHAGGLAKNSKGGFSLTHSSGKLRITRTLKAQPKWDERADEAVALINEFLEAKLKKTKHYSIIHTLLEKNKAGELSYPMVMRLQEIKDEYDDPRWIRAMDLLAESYERVYSGYGYEFYRKDEQGKFQKVEINFTSL